MEVVWFLELDFGAEASRRPAQQPPAYDDLVTTAAHTVPASCPGDLGRWLHDPGAGGGLDFTRLNLAQRRTHVLAAALAGLDPAHRRLLGWLAVLPGSIDYDTLESVNPFRSPRPDPLALLTDGAGQPEADAAHAAELAA